MGMRYKIAWNLQQGIQCRGINRQDFELKLIEDRLFKIVKDQKYRALRAD